MIGYAVFVQFPGDIDSCNDKIFKTKEAAINYVRRRYQCLCNKHGWFGLNLVDFDDGYVEVVKHIIIPRFVVAYGNRGFELLEIKPNKKSWAKIKSQM